jgi:hypothetical protein
LFFGLFCVLTLVLCDRCILYAMVFLYVVPEFFRAVKISGVQGFEQFSWFLNNLDCAY